MDPLELPLNGVFLDAIGIVSRACSSEREAAGRMFRRMCKSDAGATLCILERPKQAPVVKTEAQVHALFDCMAKKTAEKQENKELRSRCLAFLLRQHVPPLPADQQGGWLKGRKCLQISEASRIL